MTKSYQAVCKVCGKRHHVKPVNTPRPIYKGSEPEGKDTGRGDGSNARISWKKSKSKKGNR